MTLLVGLAALQGASGTPLNVPAPAQYTTPSNSNSLSPFEVGGIAVVVALLVLLMLYFMVIRRRGGGGGATEDAAAGGAAETEAPAEPEMTGEAGETTEGGASSDMTTEGSSSGEEAAGEDGGAAAVAGSAAAATETWDETGGKEDIDNLMNELDEISDSILKPDGTPLKKGAASKAPPADDDPDETNA